MEDFHKWREQMGFNAKQIVLAGQAIGLAKDRAKRISQGHLELSQTERYAMTAALLGLPAWTPAENDQLLVTKTFIDAASGIRSTPKPVSEAA